MSLAPKKQQQQQEEEDKKLEEEKQKLEEQKEAKKKAAEDKEQQKEKILEVYRSNFLSETDRETLLMEYTKRLQTDGIFGLFPIDMQMHKNQMITKKKEMENRDELQVYQRSDEQENKRLQKNVLDNLTKKDGIFVDIGDNQLQLVDQQRTEQRLLWTERNFDYFSNNGDLIIDHHFLDTKIIKMLTISMESNPLYSVYRRPAVLCERLNQNKHIPFKLNIFIGKILLTKHPLNNTEERLLYDLKQQLKVYRERVDMALIPHYSKILKLIENEHSEMSKKPNLPVKEIEILLNEQKRITAERQKEIELITQLMIGIINRWRDITAERKGYSTTPFSLCYKEYRNQEGGNEIEIGLCKDKENYTDDTDVNLPKGELIRRQTIHKDQIFIKLLVNNQEVSKTTPQPIDFPSFEATIMEKFQILLFTKPSSIKMQIYLQKFPIPKLIDTVEIEIPGERVKSITSASRLLKEVEFFMGANARKLAKEKELEKKKAQQKQDDDQKNNENKDEKQNENDPAQEVAKAEGEKVIEPEKQQTEKLKDLEEQKKIEEAEEKKAREEALFEGKLTYLSEWSGCGPKMPPDNMDNFGSGKLQMIMEDEDDYEKQKMMKMIDEQGFHFDVNDPRNEEYFEKLRDQRNKVQLQHILNDKMMPFYNVPSYRQKLIKIRQQNPDITQIPINEMDIASNLKLIELIEEAEKDVVDEQDDENSKQEKIKQHQYNMQNVAIKDIFEYQSADTKTRQKYARLKKRSLKSGAPLSLKNVIKEFRFEEKDFLCAEIIKSIFTQKRKLQPKVSGGNNVPIRLQAKTLIDDFRKQRQPDNQQQNYQGQFRGFGGYDGMDGYGNQMANQGQNNKQQIQLEEIIRVNSYLEVRLLGLEDKNEEQNQQQVDNNKKEKGRVAQKIVINPELIQQTKRYEGQYPDWNSDLNLILRSKDKSSGFNIYELNDSKKILIISLFDDIGKIKERQDKRKRLTIAIENYYLGSVVIPLSQLFYNPKMHAKFLITRPIVLFGYYISQKSLLGVSDNANNNTGRQEEEELNYVNPKIPTTVSMAINLDPVLDMPEQNDIEYYGSQEDSELLFYGQAWLLQAKKDSLLSKRYIKIWGEDIEQTSWFLPRYISQSGLKPPFNDINIHSIEKAARYVSLIPFKNDTEHFVDVPDSFCTCQQFLDLRGGDNEEHAILLCNYFNFIDQQLTGELVRSYVIMGTAIPEGKTYYVLRRCASSNTAEIWNPATGDPYMMANKEFISTFLCLKVGSYRQTEVDNFDEACPLQEVGCVFNHQNIFINIQKYTAPNQISWNIDDSKCWQPFLDQNRLNKIFPGGDIPCIQTKMIYEPTPQQYVQQLQETIQSFLIDKIREIRENEVVPLDTRFNREESQKINKILLKSLESIKFTCRLSGLSSVLLNTGQQPLGVGEPGQPPIQQQQPDNNQGNLNRGQEIRQREKQAIIELGDICKNLQDAVENLNKKIYGFPLNFTFTDYEKIWTEIKATGIHDYMKNNVEYVCSVECFEYPNFIISVWVFIAVLYEDFSQK